jgi:hypothetical protein
MVANWLNFELSSVQEDRFRYSGFKPEVILARISILMILQIVAAFAINKVCVQPDRPPHYLFNEEGEFL